MSKMLKEISTGLIQLMISFAVGVAATAFVYSILCLWLPKALTQIERWIKQAEHDGR